MSRLKRSNVIFSWLSVLVLASASAPVTAQEWPTKPLKIIVPFSAGGSLDGTTRLVAQRLSERLQQQVLVENVTGAGGSIGFQRAIQAAPDGYTFFMAGDSPLNPNAPPGGPYYTFDVLKDLQPVVLVNTAPMVLVTNPSMRQKSERVGGAGQAQPRQVFLCFIRHRHIASFGHRDDQASRGLPHGAYPVPGGWANRQ